LPAGRWGPPVRVVSYLQPVASPWLRRPPRHPGTLPSIAPLPLPPSSTPWMLSGALITATSSPTRNASSAQAPPPPREHVSFISAFSYIVFEPSTL
jgi:hypothetical protein